MNPSPSDLRRLAATALRAGDGWAAEQLAHAASCSTNPDPGPDGWGYILWDEGETEDLPVPSLGSRNAAKKIAGGRDHTCLTNRQAGALLRDR